jgi:hypothetical protein
MCCFASSSCRDRVTIFSDSSEEEETFLAPRALPGSAADEETTLLLFFLLLLSFALDVSGVTSMSDALLSLVVVAINDGGGSAFHRRRKRRGFRVGTRKVMIKCMSMTNIVSLYTHYNLR